MADPIQTLTPGAKQFESIQKFQNYCEKQLKNKIEAEGRYIHPGIHMDRALVLNRESHDGNFEIVYRDPSESFFCGAHVSLNNHEMVVRAGISDTQTLQGEGQLEMADACSLSRSIVANEEVKSQSCVDGKVSPELLREEVLRSPSIQFFVDFCQKQLMEKTKLNTGQLPLMPFSLAKTQLVNPDSIEPTFDLRYESLGQDFVCEATIDPQTHSMQIYTGSYKQDHEGGQLTSMEMTDACTLTRNLLGSEKAGADCQDKTREERGWEDRAEILFAGYVNYLGGKWLWGKLAGRIPALKPMPMAGFRVAGNALLAGWVFDKVTGLMLSPDNPIRKYGYYGALAGGALAPTLWKKLAQTQLIKAMTVRAVIPATLSNLLKKAPAGALARGFIGVMAFNYGVKWLFGGSDYDAWVNQRVTDEVYGEYVYELDGWDFFLLPLAIKGIRASCRELAPDAIEVGVAADNSEIKTRILQKDAKTSMDIREYMRESLLLLLTTPGFYPPTDPASYGELSLEILETAITQSPIEQGIAAAIQVSDPKHLQKIFNISDAQLNDIVKSAYLDQIQKGAAFLVAVDQPLNDWARRLFNTDGTLKADQGEALIYYLGKAGSGAVASGSEFLKTRKIQVSLSSLHGEAQFSGAPMAQVMRAAGLSEAGGAPKINGVYITALTLYASEAQETQDPERLQRLEAIGQQLRWRYLKAGASQREVIGDALKVLQIDPKTVVKQPKTVIPKLQKCLRNDSPQQKIKEVFKRFSFKLRN